jgi:hypothetical protein
MTQTLPGWTPAEAKTDVRVSPLNPQLLRVLPNKGEWAAVVHRALVKTPAAHCPGAVYAKPYEREKQQHTTQDVQYARTLLHCSPPEQHLCQSTCPKKPGAAPSAAPRAQAAAAAPRQPTRASHGTE